MQDKKICICSPIYNCLGFTKEFIASIETKHQYRIIILNNGSQDGSREWFGLSKEAKKHPITLINFDKNEGISKGANRAMQEAMNDPEITHIIYANNDIVFRPDTIDTLVWAWDNRRDDRMVRVSAVDIRESHFKTYEEGLENVMNRDIGKTKKFIYGGSYTCFIWDKEAIEKVGLLDENIDYYDDNIHAEETLRRGCFSTTFVPALVYHRGSGTLRENPKEKQAFHAKSDRDRKYALKYFGVEDQDGIREKTERGRPIWTPRIEAINTEIGGFVHDYFDRTIPA